MLTRIAVASAHETVAAPDIRDRGWLKGGQDSRGGIRVKSLANRMPKNPILVAPSSDGDVLALGDTASGLGVDSGQTCQG
jgi:hypothetical protein